MRVTTIMQDQRNKQSVQKAANDNLRRRVSPRKSIAFAHAPPKAATLDEPPNSAEIADAIAPAKRPPDTAASTLLQQSCVAYLFLPGTVAPQEPAISTPPQPLPSVAPTSASAASASAPFEHRRLTQLSEHPAPPEVAAAVRAAASPVHARLRLDTRRAVAAAAPPAALGGGATWRRVVYDPLSSLAGAKKWPAARRPAPGGPSKFPATAR
jgi:hypothetical protein